MVLYNITPPVALNRLLRGVALSLAGDSEPVCLSACLSVCSWFSPNSSAKPHTAPRRVCVLTSPSQRRVNRYVNPGSDGPRSSRAFDALIGLSSLLLLHKEMWRTSGLPALTEETSPSQKSRRVQTSGALCGKLTEAEAEINNTVKSLGVSKAKISSVLLDSCNDCGRWAF